MKTIRRKRLKRNTVYIDKGNGRIGVLVRETFWTNRLQWSLDFGNSVLPEELNSHFRQILLKEYELLGDL